MRCHLSIVRSNNQNVLSSKSVLPALFVAPGGSRLQEMLDHRTKPFNFFWRLVLIPGVLNRREPQAGAIEQSVAVEPLMSILGPRQKPTIVEDLGSEGTHIWVEAAGFAQEQPLTGADGCVAVKQMSKG
jgi:hypothetical protein